MSESEKEALDLLLTKLPEFRDFWCKYADEQAELDKEINEEFDPSLYEVASEFSRCIIEQFGCGNQEFLKDAFYLIEKLGNHPDEGISECAMVGFVEGVLMLRSHEGIELNAFDSYLGKNSKEFWYGMHDFFTGNA
ncbi:hypothetical protein ACJJI5_10535 [Microbulbifer sp. EKSA008]|uniref:DUF7674 family protein n=1 Tax=Microbulbifer sp. EKSA008 TaxID=3243367 RepID=UPI004043424F